MSAAGLPLVQYWDQPDPPEVIAERMQGWHQHHPDWCYQSFDRIRAAVFVREHYGSALHDAFLDIRLPAMQADVFRIAFVLARGGLWVDAATICFSPVKSWLDLQTPLLLLRKPKQIAPQVWNGLIYAQAPGHCFLQDAWSLISDSIRHRRGTGVHKLVGPGLLRDLLAQGRFNSVVTIQPSKPLAAYLKIGSSSKVLPVERHWSKRQRSESLYFSGG